jgi:hypothetical protein
MNRSYISILKIAVIEVSADYAYELLQKLGKCSCKLYSINYVLPTHQRPIDGYRLAELSGNWHLDELTGLEAD